MSYLRKKILALAVALVRSAIPYSQLSFSDWTLGPTLIVVLSLVPPLSPSPRPHRSPCCPLLPSYIGYSPTLPSPSQENGVLTFYPSPALLLLSLQSPSLQK